MPSNIEEVEINRRDRKDTIPASVELRFLKCQILVLLSKDIYKQKGSMSMIWRF